MMQKKFLMLLPALSMATACQTLPSVTSDMINTDKQNVSAQLIELNAKNHALNERIAMLETRQDNLERSLAVLANNTHTLAHTSVETSLSVLQQAQNAFTAKQYIQVVTLLQSIGNAPLTDESAAKRLWLLARSHEKLAHCESAMQVAKHLTRRYPADANAPEAWLLIARCQIRIQQKDIARDTLRYLIATYPHSNTAKHAQFLLKNL